MRRKRLNIIAATLLLALLIGGLGWQVSVTVRQERLDHALIAAIERDNTRLALELLKQGADPNTKAVPGMSQPLWQVLWNSLWHRHGSQTGPSALMLAVQRHNPTITQALLDAGAHDVNAHIYGNDDYNPGTTLLMAETVNKDADTAQALLKHGAQVDARDDLGTSALMLVEDDRCAQLLLSRGADVNARDRYGTTVLIHAIDNEGPWIARLLDHGADMNAANQSGMTALMQAVSSGQVENVRLLLARGANPNAKDKRGLTALKIANQIARQMEGIVGAPKIIPEIIPLLKQAGAKE